MHHDEFPGTTSEEAHDDVGNDIAAPRAQPLR